MIVVQLIASHFWISKRANPELTLAGFEIVPKFCSQRQKLPSTEDEHEMRALLLSDLAKRRAKDAKTSEQSKVII